MTYHPNRCEFEVELEPPNRPSLFWLGISLGAILGMAIAAMVQLFLIDWPAVCAMVAR